MSQPTHTNLIVGIQDLDFEGIKANLIRFLKDNNDFPDAAYTGSAFNTLLDVMAYNTHYQMLYANFTMNEAFLDSCSKYTSAVSLSKSLGYVPYSVTAARLQLSRIEASAATYIPRGARFRASWAGESFAFTTMDAIGVAVETQPGRWSSPPATAYYGTYTEELQTLQRQAPGGRAYNTKAIVANKTADISTLRVSMLNQLTGQFESWTKSVEFTSIGPTDKAYFLRLRDDLHYEISFGDGVIGKSPAAEGIYSAIRLEYITVPPEREQPTELLLSSIILTSGMDPDISFVTYPDPVTPFIRGSDRESIESIKFNAPKAYTAQNRAVTKSDYATLVTQQFGWVESVRVWGGEDNSPPRYGAVFLSVKPRGSRKFTTANEKSSIVSYLKNSKSMLTITPIIVDPKYTDVIITSNVTIDGSRIAADSRTIAEVLKQTTADYISSLYLTNDTLRISELSSRLDSAVYGVIGNDTSITLRQVLPVILGVSGKYELRIDNQIAQTKEEAVYSSRFKLAGSDRWHYVASNTDGGLILKQIDDTGKVIGTSTVGTVDLAKGIISMDALTITKTESNDYTWSWTITPAFRDIRPIREMILTCDPADVNIRFSYDTAPMNQIGAV
jgi:hypothetical protein